MRYDRVAERPPSTEPHKTSNAHSNEHSQGGIERMKTHVNPAWKIALALLMAGAVVVVSGQLWIGGKIQAQTSSASDQSGPGPGPFASAGPGCNFFPPSAAVGAGVDPSYFGPPPSQSNPSLVGPLQLLRSGPVSFEDGTITLPLYRGKVREGNKTVWFILTDTSDANAASSLGLNFSQKLQFSAVGARTANLDTSGQMIFDSGTVDFRPVRRLVAGPANQPFPPAVFEPGSIGDRDYSPLVKIVNGGGIIYNAPMIAFDVEAAQINFPDGNPDYRLVHDQVRRIDPYERTVTLNLINGFSFGRPVLYISMEANDPLPAAVEGNTFAPLLRNIAVGQDDSFSSAVERIFVAVNGPFEGGCDNPQRQGLFATLTDGFRPNNTFGGIPTIALDYSPLWDFNVFEWTQDAIGEGYRSQLREEFHILGLVEHGFLTGPGGAPFGSTGFIVNCPIVQRLL
jgi:hypothetical protein